MVNRNKLLLGFYGDDFTGSTDVMETLALNGLPTALFLKTPTQDEIENFNLKRNVGGHQLKAFGVAGIARSLRPADMQVELNAIFFALAKIPVDYFQYKICSTLDSAPEVGNIGIATDLALNYFPSVDIPLIVGAPFLNRFVVFSNLFARLDHTTYRIDKHPVMSRHPVTPMREGDIRLHLGKQTSRKFRTVDILSLNENASQQDIFSTASEKAPEFILFDTLTNEDLVKIGSLIYNNYQGITQLIVGSSGISYGLARYLEDQHLEQANETDVCLSPVSQILVAAGSCSPVTERQIQYAVSKGMTGIRIEVMKLLENKEEEIQRVQKQALQILDQGNSPVLFTALGPGDPSIPILENSGQNRNTLLGESIGEIVSRILDEKPKLRTVIVGGDTSGYVSRYLQIYALETLAPVAPGAPLCVAHAADPRFDGLEIALKGGQNGKDDYFERILG